ncbi:hypothetical protein [Streptomyces olivaceus]|uniref:hypothetical protein n=1 Tax=Streptomyces olivaceus TaxID=47716 RepID=UPI004055F28D
MFTRTAESEPDVRARCAQAITFRRMVSSPHEALHRIFRVDPGLFARLLPRAGIDFPEHTVIEPLDTDLTEPLSS